jgi:uncharacterized protein (TIGR02996 family)
MLDDLPLAAILAEPSNRGLRLEYANWMQARGDSRHELIRVCERMLQVPNSSDEYWRLKERRNELRVGCPEEWLAMTGYDGSGYDPIFRDGISEDGKGRWRIVREFTERWHGIPMVDVGGRPNEIQEAEQRLGVKLPPSVREFVAFAHDVFPRPDYRVVLRDGYLMQRMPNSPAISLMIQGEGDMQWAVQLADLADPDPPVHTYVFDPEDSGPDETRPFVSYPNLRPVPLSKWMFDYVEAYHGATSEFATSVQDVDRLRRQIEAEFSMYRATPGGVGMGRYEHPAGILASLAPDAGSAWRPGKPYFRLWVGVRAGVPWQAVPEFLWEYARLKHMCGGMFFSQEDIESSLLHWGTDPLPAGFLREAAPPMRLSLVRLRDEPPVWREEDEVPF